MPENHLAYVVSDVIDQLDLSAMDEVYTAVRSVAGCLTTFGMMTKLLAYGYCLGVFTSRRIILLRGGVSQGSGTGVAASSSASAASACTRSRSAKGEPFPSSSSGHSSSLCVCWQWL
jgi:hypothetical protein